MWLLWLCGAIYRENVVTAEYTNFRTAIALVVVLEQLVLLVVVLASTSGCVRTATTGGWRCFFFFSLFLRKRTGLNEPRTVWFTPLP